MPAQAHFLLCFRVDNGVASVVDAGIYSESHEEITSGDGYYFAQVASMEGETYEQAKRNLEELLKKYRKQLYALLQSRGKSA